MSELTVVGTIFTALILFFLLILLRSRRENKKTVEQAEELIDEIRNIPPVEPNDIIEDDFGKVPVACQVMNLLDRFAAEADNPEGYKSRVLFAAGWNVKVDGDFTEKPERAARAMNRIIKSMLQYPLSEGLLINIEYKRSRYWAESGESK